jgi:hypothetical protein
LRSMVVRKFESPHVVCGAYTHEKDARETNVCYPAQEDSESFKKHKMEDHLSTARVNITSSEKKSAKC